MEGAILDIYSFCSLNHYKISVVYFFPNFSPIYYHYILEWRFKVMIYFSQFLTSVRYNFTTGKAMAVSQKSVKKSLVYFENKSHLISTFAESLHRITAGRRFTILFLIGFDQFGRILLFKMCTVPRQSAY